MSQKFITIAVASILSILTLNIVHAEFNDVVTNYEFYNSINYVQSRNIVSGFSDGSYKPEKPITRIEFTKIIINALFPESEISNCTSIFFPDVPSTNTFAKYVCMARTHNIVSGFSNGTFNPDKQITIAEASKILSNGFGFTSEIQAPTNTGDVFQRYVDELATRHVYPNTMRSLDYPLTRGQMAEMIYRIKENVTMNPSKTYAELSHKYFTYNTYKDNYVSFDYPKNWTTNVVSGPNAVVESCKAQNGSREGVQSISISNGFNFDISLQTFCTNADFGFDSPYTFNLTQPNTIWETKYDYSTYPAPPTITLIPRTFQSNVFIRNNYILGDKMLLLATNGKLPLEFESDLRTYALTNFEFKGDNLYYVLGYPRPTFQDLPYMGHDLPTLQISGMLIEIDNKCNVDNEDEANQCEEFVNRFFMSAKKMN